MTTQILIGDIARTVGPLKPTGKISVNDQTINAYSEGLWIDSETEVVIAGGHTGRVLVRAISEDMVPVEQHGQPLPEQEVPAITPLHSPAAWVERINSVAIGVVIGCLLVPLAWLTGMPLHPSAFVVPLAGGVAGRLFRGFVASSIQSAGPREDHRPAAFGIAGMVIVCAILGVAIGLAVGHSFVGLSTGLVVGALVGGVMSWVAILIMNS